MAKVFSQDVIEIAVLGHIGTHSTVNVWHLRATEAPDHLDEDHAEVFRQSYQDLIVPLATPDWFLDGFTWVSLDPDDANAGELAPLTTEPVRGEMTGASAPPNVCALVQKITPNRPRGRRDGRAYLPGVRETDVDVNGKFDAPTLTTYNNALSNFYAAVDDAGVAEGTTEWLRHFVVLETTPESRIPGTQEVIINSRRVTSLKLDPIVATQRNRLR